MNEERQNELRLRIKAMLLTLDLSGFEQTTHGRIGGGSIEDVSRTLVAAYNDPRAFTISDLSQAIRGFLRAQK